MAWCTMKEELVGVAAMVAGVCGDKACVDKARGACTKTHPCGHHCGGVRGERDCLPCLEVRWALEGVQWGRGEMGTDWTG